MADKNQSREIGQLHVKVNVDVSEALTGLKALQREAKRATQALRELDEAQKETYAKRLADANEMLAVQGCEGNWNVDDYMHGMYNGMEYVLALIEDREPAFRKAPTKFIHEELVRREGVKEYVVDAHGGTAKIFIDNGNEGDNIIVDGPAKIVVNKD
jgi:hypothetical protein